MNTLKIAYDVVYGDPAHIITRELWVSDVESVERANRVVVETWEQAHEAYTAGQVCAQLEDRPTPAPTGTTTTTTECYPTRAKVLHVLFVKLKGEPTDRIMLVEKAWLLSPTGATLDRVAP